MNRYFLPLFLVILATCSIGVHDGSVTTITIAPDIEKEFTSVIQTYNLLQEGITQFTILTVSLSYADLRIFDDTGTLEYAIGDNIIHGKNIYRTITVFFREPISPPYTFFVTYWLPSTAAGKPLTGKYQLNIVNITDSTFINFNIPLRGIKETARASPHPQVEEKEDSTTFSYHVFEDASIVLSYEPKEGIDYSSTKTETFSNEGYTFDVTYPQEAAIFLEDIEFFITQVFPIYLEETGIPLRFSHIDISLEKQEDTWAAAEYRGNGKIGILINNTSSYPSQFLAHELTHSYIGDFVRYLEEGMANYFERQTERYFDPPRPKDFIPNEESYYQTYERQFDETVKITASRYGLGITYHQEALIYAKYNKGTHVIHEIASECGHETVQEMLHILSEDQYCTVNQLISELSRGDTVYEILKKYEFDVVPPYAYPAEKVLQEVIQQSWWSHVLCSLCLFDTKVKTTPSQDIEVLVADIEFVGKIASYTVMLTNGVVFSIVLFCVFVTLRKVNRVRKGNPTIVYYFYFIPVAVVVTVFSYFLYEFLFSGYKFRWILKSLLIPWVAGIVTGIGVILFLERIIPKEYEAKFIVDVVWTISLFGLLITGTYFFGLDGLLFGLGYTVSLVGLFIIRKKQN